MGNLLAKIASMGIGELCNGVGGLANDIRSAITGDISPTDKATLREKLVEMEFLTQQLNVEVEKTKASIIIAEAKGDSWLQRNWRPLLMVLFGFIIANNYLVYPYLSLFWQDAPTIALPNYMWELLKIGVGGYVGGRTIEKAVKSWKGKV